LASVKTVPDKPLASAKSAPNNLGHLLVALVLDDNIPAVPCHGSASVSVPVLLAWHAKILAATHDHAAVTAALEATDQCCHLVMGNYLLLIGGQHVNDCLLGAKDPRQPPAVEGNRKGKGCGCPFGLEDGEKGNGVL